MSPGDRAEYRALRRQQANERKTAAQAARIRAAQELRAQEEDAAFRQTPVGLALSAKARNEGFFEIQLRAGVTGREGRVNSTPVVGTLAAIEATGWILEHVGYVREETGDTVGVYLFRNAERSSRPPPRRQAH